MKRFLLLISILIFSEIALADYINLLRYDQCPSLMVTEITDSLITVKLEIGQKDYPIFFDVVPDSLIGGGFSGKDKNIRFEKFLKSGLILRMGNRPLKGKIKEWELGKSVLRADPAGQSVDPETAEQKFIYLRISYPLHGESGPLTLRPPVSENNPDQIAELCLLVFHKSIPLNDPALLTGSVNIHLRQDDPWYSYFDDPAFVRHHSSSFMGFLYIEPYEVRYEALIRVKDLEKELRLDYGIDDILDEDDREEILQRISEFFKRHNKTEMDGIPAHPIEEKVNFVELTLSGVQILDKQKKLSYGSALIGIIQVFPDKGIPEAVNISWDVFNEKIQSIPVLSVDPSGPWPYELTPVDSILRWTNFLKHYSLPTVSAQRQEPLEINLPVLTLLSAVIVLVLLIRFGGRFADMSKPLKFLSAALAGVAIAAFPLQYELSVPFLKKNTYAPAEAKQLITELLKNTYRAFDFRNEEAVYDRLAVSNDADLVQELYLQMRESMVIENRGGLEAKVEEVLVTSAEPVVNASQGLAFRCSWIVKGVVGHWGHQHRRINRYTAVIKIKPVDGVWKMYEIDILEETRL